MGKKKTKTKETTNSTSTSTPNVDPRLQAPIYNQADMIGRLQNRNGRDFVAGASPLQSAAFSRLMGGAAMPPIKAPPSNQSPLSTIKASGDGRYRMGGDNPLRATNAPQAAQTPQMGRSRPMNGFNATQDIAQGVAQAGANTADPVQGYEPSQVTAETAGPVALFGGATAGPVKEVQAQSLLTNLNDYQNPYTQDVVDASLADFDENAGRLRAQQAAIAAGNRSYGGSRSAVLEALTEGELSRGRNAIGSELRRDAFNTAANLSNMDANRRQSAEAQNIGAENNLSLFDAGNQQQAGLAAANAINSRDSESAAYRNQANMVNADAANSASRFNLGQEQQNRQFNAGQSDDALSRQLSAAGLMGSLQGQANNDNRADIAQLLQAGGVQRDIAQQEAGSELALAQLLSQLTGNLPIDSVSGRTVNSSGTSTGTTTESGGGLGKALGIGAEILGATLFGKPPVGV